MPEKTLTFKIVVSRTGLSRSTINDLREKGKFPKALQLSEGRIGWRESDIDNWINSRPVANIEKKKIK